MSRSAIRSVLFSLLCLFAALPLIAWCADGSGLVRDLPPGLQVPAAAQPGPGFDVDRATQAYLDLLSPEQRARSDAYFEGGYWLILWNFLFSTAVAMLLLFTGGSKRMRDAAQRWARWRWLSTALYAAMWLIVVELIGLPWAYYTEFVREHAYGLSTQTFGAWLGEGFTGFGYMILVMPLVIAGLYAVLRRAGERWWMIAGLCACGLILVGTMLVPVFIAPAFNTYQPLPPGETRDAILSLARANRIPTEHVEWFDASRQTTRISANVSGFAGTTRVNLNDNLLKKTSLPEIKAVMGHEMGHYVLNHPLRLSIYMSLLMTFGFWFVHATFGWAQRRWGARMGVEGITDPAGLPLFAALFGLFLFLATPVSNSIVRQAEAEADAYGLNAAGEPHGFATAAMRLSTYRKIHPGHWEEILFYDHPSGYDRVHRSMEWAKEHPQAGAAAKLQTPPQ